MGLFKKRKELIIIVICPSCDHVNRLQPRPGMIGVRCTQCGRIDWFQGGLHDRRDRTL